MNSSDARRYQARLKLLFFLSLLGEIKKAFRDITLNELKVVYLRLSSQISSEKN